uniref:Uncharacterized protein n=1 Tax=Trichuris muris TaxID=70415 RepID=A0A5S6QCR0_TRIMR
MKGRSQAPRNWYARNVPLALTPDRGSSNVRKASEARVEPFELAIVRSFRESCPGDRLALPLVSKACRQHEGVSTPRNSPSSTPGQYGFPTLAFLLDNGLRGLKGPDGLHVCGCMLAHLLLANTFSPLCEQWHQVCHFAYSLRAALLLASLMPNFRFTSNSKFRLRHWHIVFVRSFRLPFPAALSFTQVLSFPRRIFCRQTAGSATGGETQDLDYFVYSFRRKGVAQTAHA